MRYSNSSIVYIENNEMRHMCIFIVFRFKKICNMFTVSLLSLLIHNIHVHYYIKIQCKVGAK